MVDLAKAHVVAIDRMLENKHKERYEVFNIGTGKGLSVLELLQTFEKVNDLKLNYKIVDRRAGDVPAVFNDATFANEELGWKSESSIEETLASAWKLEKKVRGIK